MTDSRRASIVVLAVAVVGVAIGCYLTVVHYGAAPLVCTSGTVVNCEQVLTSAYSVVGGIPLSLLGLGWFAGSAALALITLRSQEEPVFLQPLQLTWALLGVGVVAYLVGVELFALKRICLWCTAMHLLIGTTFILTLLREPAEGTRI